MIKKVKKILQLTPIFRNIRISLWRTFIHLVWSTISELWYSHCTIDGKNGKEIQVKAQWSNHIKCCIKSSPSIFLVSFQTSLQRGSKFKHFLESNIYQWMSLKKRKKIKNKPKKTKTQTNNKEKRQCRPIMLFKYVNFSAFTLLSQWTYSKLNSAQVESTTLKGKLVSFGISSLKKTKQLKPTKLTNKRENKANI